MKRVRYEGRGRLLVFDQELRSGQVGEFTDEQADELALHPRIPVTILGVTITHADGTTTHHPDRTAAMSTTKKRRTTKKEE